VTHERTGYANGTDLTLIVEPDASFALATSGGQAVSGEAADDDLFDITQVGVEIFTVREGEDGVALRFGRVRDK
jgi:hypothetical protein